MLTVEETNLINTMDELNRLAPTLAQVYAPDFNGVDTDRQTQISIVCAKIALQIKAMMEIRHAAGQHGFGDEFFKEFVAKWPESMREGLICAGLINFSEITPDIA